MAIATYSDLQAAIASWGNRSDLTTTIVDIITLAEARLNDMLLLKNMESEESLTLVVSQNFVVIPTGYISPIALWLVVDNQRLLLEPALPQELPYRSENAQPRYWAIDGANIRFDCPAYAAYSGKFRMVKQSNLSGSVTTNALLTKRPDVYLAACMVEFYRFDRDPENMSVWEQKFQEAAKGLMDAENRARGIVSLRTDIPMRLRSNIFRGD